MSDKKTSQALNLGASAFVPGASKSTLPKSDKPDKTDEEAKPKLNLSSKPYEPKKASQPGQKPMGTSYQPFSQGRGFARPQVAYTGQPMVSGHYGYPQPGRGMTAMGYNPNIPATQMAGMNGYVVRAGTNSAFPQGMSASRYTPAVPNQYATNIPNTAAATKSFNPPTTTTQKPQEQPKTEVLEQNTFKEPETKPTFAKTADKPKVDILGAVNDTTPKDKKEAAEQMDKAFENMDAFKPKEEPKPEIKEETKEEPKEEKRIPISTGTPSENRRKIIIGDDSQIKGKPFSVEYLEQFKTWKIASERTLLDAKLCSILDELSNPVEEKVSQNQHKGRDNNKYNNRKSGMPRGQRSNDQAQPTGKPSLAKWQKVNYKEEEEAAKKFKDDYDAHLKKEGIKLEIKQTLSKLTVDNFDQVKKEIFDMTKDSEDSQSKLTEVIFTKATMENGYCELYAKLISQLSKMFDQVKPKESEQKSGGIRDVIQTDKEEKKQFRNTLIEKVKTVFKKTKKEILELIESDDRDDIENFLKQYTLGNVNFISELIQNRFLSKNIFNQCCEGMFEKIKDVEDSYFDEEINKKEFFLNIQGIVLANDKLGTYLNRVFVNTKANSKDKEEKIKSDLNKYNSIVDDWVAKLEELVKKYKKHIPGFIEYKVINLRYKKAAGWEDTLIDKSRKVKGLADVKNEDDETKLKTGNKSRNKLSEEDLEMAVKKDYKIFSVFKKDGGREYDWVKVTELVEDLGHSVGEILEAYSMFITDLATREDDIKIAQDYMIEIISYYNSKGGHANAEINQLRKNLIDCIENVPFSVSECKFIQEIWTGIVAHCVKYKLFDYKDFSLFGEAESDEDLEVILDVLVGAFKNQQKFFDISSKIKDFNFIKKKQSILAKKWVDEEF